MAQSSELLAEPRDTRPHLHTVFHPYSIVSHLTLASPFPGSTFMPAKYFVYVSMWAILWTTQKQLEIHTSMHSKLWVCLPRRMEVCQSGGQCAGAAGQSGARGGTHHLSTTD